MTATNEETQPPVCRVIGVPLAATDYAGAIELAKRWAGEADRPRLIEAAASHCVTTARHDPDFQRALDRFDLIVPDGMPLVWVMNRTLERPLKDRVYGPTLMLRCLEATQGEPWSHALVGGSDELLAELQQKLLQKFPALRIALAYSPPYGQWPAAEDEKIIELIRRSGAQFVWIGLGCPKQEFWLARNKDRLPQGVHFGVGAAFAFHAGRVRQAPAWMQKRGLEWLYRVLTEPGRLWRRYLVYNSLFIYYVIHDGLFGTRPV